MSSFAQRQHSGIDVPKAAGAVNDGTLPERAQRDESPREFSYNLALSNAQRDAVVADAGRKMTYDFTYLPPQFCSENPMTPNDSGNPGERIPEIRGNDLMEVIGRYASLPPLPEIGSETRQVGSERLPEIGKESRTGDKSEGN